MNAVNPYLNFPGNTEEAFDFYRSVFGGEFIGGIRRFADFGDAMGDLSEEDRNKVAHVALPLQKTEWADRFGMCVDRFGVQWMFSYTGGRS